VKYLSAIFYLKNYTKITYSNDPANAYEYLLQFTPNCKVNV